MIKKILRYFSHGKLKPLFIAIMDGNLTKVQQMVRKTPNLLNECLSNSEESNDLSKNLFGNKFDINHQIIIGAKPCHLAVIFGRIEILDWLLTQVDIRIEDSYTHSIFCSNDKECFSPLHFAAFFGQLIILKRLIEEKGMQFVKSDQENNIPSVLISAVLGGQYDIVHYLVEELSMNPIQYYDRKSTLTIAAACGHFKIVCYLIDQTKAKQNFTNDLLDDPLNAATRCGMYKIVRYFKEQCGFNFDAQPHRLKDLLVSAAKGELTNICNLGKFKYCTEKNEDDFERSDHVQLLQYFIEHLKADPKQAASSGIMPIHNAIRGNQSRAVSYLIKTNKDVCNFIEMKSRMTPLILAVRLERFEIIRSLIEDFGVDIIAVNDGGIKVLKHAAIYILEYFFIKEAEIHHIINLDESELRNMQYYKSGKHMILHSGENKVIQALRERLDLQRKVKAGFLDLQKNRSEMVSLLDRVVNTNLGLKGLCPYTVSGLITDFCLFVPPKNKKKDECSSEQKITTEPMSNDLVFHS